MSRMEAIRSGVHVSTNLHFVGVSSDSQGFVCSSGQGVILNHDHLHPSAFLQGDQETLGQKVLGPGALGPRTRGPGS